MIFNEADSFLVEILFFFGTSVYICPGAFLNDCQCKTFAILDNGSVKFLVAKVL